MEDLIKALQIFLKYGNPYSPIHCEHDEMFVAIEPEKVSEEDITALGELGFMPCDTNEIFYSFRFGSC